MARVIDNSAGSTAPPGPLPCAAGQHGAVEGHASADGRHAHNVELSKRRAEALVEHLVRHGNVAAERLESEGYGPDRPIANNESEVGREANRRVEFTIVEQEYTQTRKIIDTQTGSNRREGHATFTYVFRVVPDEAPDQPPQP